MLHAMNARSKTERGKGKRRQVHGTAGKTAAKKRVSARAPTTPKLPKPSELKPTAEQVDRLQVREKVLDRLAELSEDCIKALRHSIALGGRGGVRLRGSGQASADAKWLLEQLFEKAERAAPAAPGASEAPSGDGSVVDLVARRRELQNLLRRQRRDMNK